MGRRRIVATLAKRSHPTPLVILAVFVSRKRVVLVATQERPIAVRRVHPIELEAAADDTLEVWHPAGANGLGRQVVDKKRLLFVTGSLLVEKLLD